MSGVVTRYVGSGIERGEIRDQKGGIWDHSPGIGISSVFRDQAVPFLWDQRRKLVTHLKTRIRNLRTKMGSAMKKHTSLPPCIRVDYSGVTSIAIFGALRLNIRHQRQSTVVEYICNL